MAHMAHEYEIHTHDMTGAILYDAGVTSPELRDAIESYTAALSGRRTSDKVLVPEELTDYLKKIALHAYKITDEDVAVLQQAGYSDEALFEITLTAALGAGIARLERGLSALESEEA